MAVSEENLKMSATAFVVLAVFGVLALMTDVSALVLAASEIRATKAAYAVYASAAALSLAAGVSLAIKRKAIRAIVTDTFFSAKLVTRLRKFDAFDRVFTDYGWRTLLMAVLTLAGNIV